MTPKDLKLRQYISIMLATEIMINNPKLRSMNDLPESLRDELGDITSAIIANFNNIEKFVSENGQNGEKSVLSILS